MNENVVKALRVCTSERTISKCSKICPYHNVQDCRTKLMIDAADAIEVLTHADVVPVVHGKWMRIDKYDPESNVQCSACLQDYDYNDDIAWIVSGHQFPPFCPNCGAKMEPPKEVE